VFPVAEPVSERSDEAEFRHADRDDLRQRGENQQSVRRFQPRDGGGVRRGNRAAIRVRLQREGSSGASPRQSAESDDAERVRLGESPGARENVGGREARLHGTGCV